MVGLPVIDESIIPETRHYSPTVLFTTRECYGEMEIRSGSVWQRYDAVSGQRPGKKSFSNPRQSVTLVDWTLAHRSQQSLKAHEELSTWPLACGGRYETVYEALPTQ